MTTETLVTGQRGLARRSKRESQFNILLSAAPTQVSGGAPDHISLGLVVGVKRPLSSRCMILGTRQHNWKISIKLF